MDSRMGCDLSCGFLNLVFSFFWKFIKQNFNRGYFIVVCILVRWGYFVYILVGQMVCVVAALCSLGLFYFAENFKYRWVKILHCRWVMCVCCCYVLELGGCCPTLSKFVVLGFLVCDGIPTPSKRTWPVLGWCRYHNLKISTNPGVYNYLHFCSINIYMETKSSILCTCTKSNCF